MRLRGYHAGGGDDNAVGAIGLAATENPFHTVEAGLDAFSFNDGPMYAGSTYIDGDITPPEMDWPAKAWNQPQPSSHYERALTPKDAPTTAHPPCPPPSNRLATATAPPSSATPALPREEAPRRGPDSLRHPATAAGPPMARPTQMARDYMRPPKYGGHSKRDQLGSVMESWGPMPDDQFRVGLFQAEPEPDRRTPPPVLRKSRQPRGGRSAAQARGEALTRARAGTFMEGHATSSR